MLLTSLEGNKRNVKIQNVQVHARVIHTDSK